MALPLKLSYIELQNAKDVESVHLEFDSVKYPITQSREKSNTFSKEFDTPLTLETAPLSFTISRKKQRCSCLSSADPEIVTIHPNDIRPKLNGREFLHKWGRGSIKLGFPPQPQPDASAPSAAASLPTKPEGPQPTTEKPVVIQSKSADAVLSPAPPNALAPFDTPANHEGLRPTTKDLIELCPRFRVLVVGKSGVGKSTLINRIFGVEMANVAQDRPGEADIEHEFTSPQNDRLILHDSQGFEPGDSGNYETVKSFIEKRKKMPAIKDQLHAVWLCFQIPIPTHGERLLEDAAEAFLKIGREVLGDTPTIIVFTKYDRLASYMRHKKPGSSGAEQQYLQEYCIQPIEDFTGGANMPHVAVSSKPKYVQGLEELTNLTQEKVSESFTSPEDQVSAVPLAAAGAQRMLPTLKVEFSIDVGRQRYWMALGASANFLGYTMQNCLGVIHADIVLVWNFYDPCKYLDSKEFRDVMLNMVERVDAPAQSNSHLSRNDTLSEGGVPLIGLAPVMLPLNACLTLGKWAYERYQRLQDTPTKFMAYIIDLTHVLEILFSLTARMRAKQLTRTAIKLAYKAYLESDWVTHAHTDIRYFQCPTTARDAVLDKITSMIPSQDREVRVSRALERMPSDIDLEKDEEWVGAEVPQ
ncbi:hypothetical protein EDC04DRAFT_3109017 [Pisolithus marmoratus]|nr:hypothetical protein EDC04DRAFT_3109017 [Pisolithus marmoratus]